MAHSKGDGGYDGGRYTDGYFYDDLLFLCGHVHCLVSEQDLGSLGAEI